MRPPLAVQALVDGQFTRIGSWQLDEAKSLVLAGAAPDVPGVYAFTMAGVAHYVGVAAASLVKRLYLYRKPGPTQKTNIRMNAILRDALSGGSCIEVFIATPPALEWNGWSVSGPEGLEAGIIKNFALPWNLRGTASAQAVAPSPPTSPAPAGLSAAAGTAEEKAQAVKRAMPLVPGNFSKRPTAGGKYGPLCDFLNGCEDDKISMTFTRIEQLVGPLPKSAGVHRAWWANHEGNSQAKGWMPARFLAEPDPAHRTVVFRRFSF